MVKKSHKFNELSDRVCIYPGCEKRIKQRLVEQKKSVPLCYKHWREIKFSNDEEEEESHVL